MKCGCYVKYRFTPTKNEPRVADQCSWAHTADLGFGQRAASTDLLAQGYVVCDGTISVSVEAVDEPYMGGSSAVLEVNYKCLTCGWQYYPELPDQYRISEFLSGIIGDFDPAVARLAFVEKTKEENARREEALARMRQPKTKK